MKFTVTWSAEAENELCDLWLAANDRTEFSRQVAAIENDLRTSADELGEAELSVDDVPLRVGHKGESRGHARATDSPSVFRHPSRRRRPVIVGC